MQSCLEKYSMAERHEEEVRSDYNRENEYTSTHRDALATGDAQGKGTGSGGHGFWLPNCNGQIGVINYSNFDTALSSGAGNNADNDARNTAMTRSLYSPVNQYSANIVDTTANIAEGQFSL